jgi:drug/metabolite transporter (DMT)-like permease
VTAPARALTGRALGTLLLIASLMGANHVAARIAFDDGLDVATAVVFRSFLPALVILFILRLKGVQVRLTSRQRRLLPAMGILIGLQSLTLYFAVARLPVAIALLTFNTYPLWSAFWSVLLYRRHPSRATLIAMPVIVFGLCLVLDAFGAMASLAAAAGGMLNALEGLGFAAVAGAAFGLALVLTEHEAMGVDPRARTAIMMTVAGLIAGVMVAWRGGVSFPATGFGWGGMAALIALYGTGITLMFTVLPRLGVVGNSAILNVEPVVALILAWLILGQRVAPLQFAGALLVVGAVVGLGLRRAEPPARIAGGASVPRQ